MSYQEPCQTCHEFDGSYSLCRHIVFIDSLFSIFSELNDYVEIDLSKHVISFFNKDVLVAKATNKGFLSFWTGLIHIERYFNVNDSINFKYDSSEFTSDSMNYIMNIQMSFLDDLNFIESLSFHGIYFV